MSHICKETFEWSKLLKVKSKVQNVKKIMQKSWMMSKSLCAVPTTYASAVVEAIISLN